ncbi:MAG: HNH endonuclease [Gammaproteobacteria bacterium]|nr:HNH endonuclease [Gammaproteobacteria bacterium]
MTRKTNKKTKNKTEPIDLLTGMSFEQRTDFSVSSIIPFTLSRYNQSFDHGFGTGVLGSVWRSNLDWILRLDGEQLYFVDDECRDGHFPLPTEDNPTKCGWLPEWKLHLVDDIYVLSHKSGLDYHFGLQIGNDFKLTQITNSVGQTQNYRYHNNEIHYIELSDGRKLYCYGNDGLLNKVVLTDSDGNAIRDLIHYEYDDKARLIKVRGDAGSNFDYFYNDNDCLIRWQDLDKTWVEHDYDDKNRAIATRTSAGYWHDSVRYDDDEDITYYTSAFGGVTEFHKDTEGRLIKQVEPDGGVLHFSYDHDLLLSETDGLGRSTSYEYDEWGNVTSVTQRDGSQHHYDYNTDSLLTAYRDPTGQAWQYHYNEQHLLTQVINPLGHQWTNEYDERGLLSSRTYPDGQTNHYQYNARGNVSVVQQQSLKYEFAYDNQDRLLSRTVTDTQTNTTQSRAWQYQGDFPKPSQVTYEDGTKAFFEYDIEGNVSKITNALGEVFSYEYGAFDKLTKQTDPLGATTEYHYNAIAEFAGVTNSKGNKWYYDFDESGRITSEVHYDKRRIAYEYDQAGQVVSQTKPDGVKLNYRYDALGRLSEMYSGDEFRFAKGLTRFQYDKASRLVLAQNDESIVEYAYNALGQVIKESLNDHTINYEYDIYGRRCKRTGDSVILGFDYDDIGNISALHIDDFNPLNLAYNSFGQETQRSSYNGFALHQSYTATGLLQSQLGGRVAGSSQLLKRQYHYDALDRVIGIDDSLRGKTEYQYNAAGQIVRLQHTGIGGGNPQTQLFGYDSELNLNSIKTAPQVNAVMQQASQTQSLNYDNAGRVITTDTHAFMYDECGRLQEKTERKNGFRPQQTIYHWDDYDQLSGVSLPNGERWQYEYDPFGRRIGKHKVNSEEQHSYDWEGDNLIAHSIYNDDELISKTQWVYEPDSFRPLAQLNQQGEDEQPQLSYIITDHAGTVSELCDESGTILWHGHQALWGKFSETIRNKDNPISCDLRYQGQIHDRETGLYYNRYRYYDSDSCQYLSSDPIGLAGGIRPQSYVADPVNWVDPLGLLETVAFGSDKVIKEVTIQMQGSRAADFKAANSNSNILGTRGNPTINAHKATYGDVTWHHVDYDPKTNQAKMQLVSRKDHEATFPHKGSVKDFEDAHGVKYGTPEAKNKAKELNKLNKIPKKKK